ncbi:MAG TPA: NAD(P)-dependent oxidoreductase [Pseudonocardiaceae bacterium]|jgi:3-hydroxyisobutyrate dehydrogenase|nr:NAD(P)-dependent oxidoreductase [Pseudonocardiaceae bacterium]
MAQRKVAVIGLGGMGAGMARALLAAGFPVTVYNRTASKAQPLRELGATIAASAEDAVRDTEVVVLSLADEAAVEQVLFGEVIWRMRPGVTVVDTSTVSPSFARNTALRLSASGIRRVEACVIGNPMMADGGQLRVFTSGVESDVDEVRDVLVALSQEIRYLGPAGRASTMKLAFNLLLGVQTAALAETVAFAEGAGLDRELLLGALNNSGWRSAVLSFRAEFMRNRSYQPAGFRAALMHKDLRLASEDSAGHSVPLPLVDLAARRFADVLAAGRGDEDAAVIAEVAPAPVPVTVD